MQDASRVDGVMVLDEDESWAPSRRGQKNRFVNRRTRPLVDLLDRRGGRGWAVDFDGGVDSGRGDQLVAGVELREREKKKKN